MNMINIIFYIFLIIGNGGSTNTTMNYIDILESSLLLPLV